MSYFTAVLAREGRKWFAHDLDAESFENLEELAGELRALGSDDEPVLFLVEREDAWWGVVRVDGEEDPRVFVSDAAGVVASRFSAILAPETDEAEEAALVRAGACAGDFDVLDDLGTSSDTMQQMCEEEMLPMDALAAIAEPAGFAEVLDSLR